MTSQKASHLYHPVTSSPEASIRSTVESITCSQGCSPTQTRLPDFQPRAQTRCLDQRAIPGASCDCHQTQTAWPQPVARLRKKMLTQSKEYFSAMPVNVSARSTEPQAYEVEDQRWFELRLTSHCQKVHVNIPSISIPALPSSV